MALSAIRFLPGTDVLETDMVRHKGVDRPRSATGATVRTEPGVTGLARTETAPVPRGLGRDRRGSVPLRIAPLVIIGLVLLVMAMLAATTL